MVWRWIDLTGVDYDSTARPGTRGPPTRSVQPESDSRSAAGASDDPRWWSWVQVQRPAERRSRTIESERNMASPIHRSMKSHGREKRCKSPSCPINPTPDIAVLGYGAPAHTRADPFVTTVVGILWRRKGDGNKEEMVRNRTRRWRQINSLSIPWWTRSGNLLTVFQDRSRVLLSFFGGGRMQKKCWRYFLFQFDFFRDHLSILNF